MGPELCTEAEGELTLEEAERHIHGAAFVTGPPVNAGIELEWLVVDRANPHRPVPPGHLDAALSSLPRPDGTLPDGSVLTCEPGGRLELSAPAGPGPLACITAASADLALVRQALEGHGLSLSGYGLDPLRDPLRVRDHPRYSAMEAYFDRVGPWGRMMMGTTAAVQLNLDAGSESGAIDGYRARWQLAHRLGPVLVAAFANSPLWRGRRTGWRSTRQAVWERLDPSRTRPPQGVPAQADPRDWWSRFALDAGLLCLRRTPPADWIAPSGHSFGSWLRGGITERPPTRTDLDDHLGTLIPPVRARGRLELRMIDAQPGDGWMVPALLTTALLDDRAAAQAAWSATESLCPASSPFPPQQVWNRAARVGVSAFELAKAALVCFEAADAALARAGVPAPLREAVSTFAERYTARGRSPADDLLDDPGATAHPADPEGFPRRP